MTQDQYIEQWMEHVNILNRIRLMLPYKSQEKLTEAQQTIEGLIKEASQFV